MGWYDRPAMRMIAFSMLLLVACSGASSTLRSSGFPEWTPVMDGTAEQPPDGDAQGGAPQGVETGQKKIEQLRGEQLAAAIRGRTIVPRRTPFETPSGEQLYIETPSGEQFRANGLYVRYSDRVQVHGRYEILEDRYCATTGEIRRCSSLYRGRDGQYYLRRVFPVASGYFPVQLID